MFIAACTGPERTTSTGEEQAVERAYWSYRDCVVGGNWESAYKILSGSQMEVYTLERFRSEYETNQNDWRRWLNEVQILKIDVDGQTASIFAKIPSLNHVFFVYWVKEKGEWKIWDNRGPGRKM